METPHWIWIPGVIGTHITTLLTWKIRLDIRRLVSTWKQLLGNISSFCVFDFTTSSDVRHPVSWGGDRRSLGCCGGVCGDHNRNLQRIIYLHPKPLLHSELWLEYQIANNQLQSFMPSTKPPPPPSCSPFPASLILIGTYWIIFQNNDRMKTYLGPYWFFSR